MFALIALYWLHGLVVEEIFGFSLIHPVLLTSVFQEGRLPFSFIRTLITLETWALVVETFQVHSEVSTVIGPVIAVLLAAVENLRPWVFRL